MEGVLFLPFAMLLNCFLGPMFKVSRVLGGGIIGIGINYGIKETFLQSFLEVFYGVMIKALIFHFPLLPYPQYPSHLTCHLTCHPYPSHLTCTLTCQPQFMHHPNLSHRTYPFLLEPSPVWMPKLPALSGYLGGENRPPSMQRTATVASSHTSCHQPLASLPADPAHQYLRSLTEALSKAGTLETLRTHPTLHTSSSNRDTSHQRTAHQSTPQSTMRDVPTMPSPTHCPWIHCHQAMCSSLN